MQTRRWKAAAWAVALGLGALGCEGDPAAIDFLEQRTADLSNTVEENNEKLEELVDEISKCRDQLTDRGPISVPRGNEVEVDRPRISGERTRASLEELERSLISAIEQQRAKGDELESLRARCKEHYQTQGAANQARERSPQENRERAERNQDANRPPKAVQKREAQGRATEGVLSRYETRGE